MKKLLPILLLFAAPAFSQAQAPTPAMSHFSVTASAVPWSGSSATQGAVVGSSVSLTSRVSAAYQHFDLSPVTYDLGLGEYTMPVASLVGKKIASKLTFNPAPWSVTFFGGGGIATGPVTTSAYSFTDKEPSFTLGLGLDYTANNHVTIRIASGQWIHTLSPSIPSGVTLISEPSANQFVTTPDIAALQSSLQITF